MCRMALEGTGNFRKTESEVNKKIKDNMLWVVWILGFILCSAAIP